MAATRCGNHVSNEAAFRCDGCGRLLCAECVTEGHRLLFCKLCGERALPLEAEAPATVPERQRAAKIEAPYSLADALRYPFRGLGLYVYLGYIVFFVLLRS